MLDNMINFILILTISFLMTVLTTPLSIRISYRKRVLDYPYDKSLKIHSSPMPILGGIAIAFGIISSWLFSAFFLKAFQQEILGLLLAFSLILLFGLFDDAKGLNPTTRLLGQFVASLVVIFVSKITVNLIPHWYISIPITIFYLMAAINSINLLDGIDGLATGTTLVASGGFLFAFILQGNALGMMISMSLIGVTAGFLLYNFSPAKIFLGDNGSTVLGLLLGVLAVLFSSKPYSLIHFVVPILIMVVPIFDTGLAIGRRIGRHRPVFHGDRDHFYDQLMRKGFSQKQTSLITYCFGLLGAIAGISFMLS